MLALTSLTSALTLSGIGLAGIGLALMGAVTGGGKTASASGRGTPEDHELVRASIEGDGMAYRCLVERYQGRIYAVIYGMVRNREDARELSQDAFVKAYKNLSRFRLESSFYTWLCRISMNVAIDHLRRQKLRRTEEFDEGIASRESAGVISLAHHREDPRRNLERKQMRERILEEIEKLPDDQRQVLVLREIDGLSYKEISSIIDIPEGTVMSRLYYARKKLQSALKEQREK
ncbi:MAG: sigma-70 family RNA polymerase sigma factor [Myxococcota bacterium]|nr:sigma-70 family RNA polymerase sigma factor [Myxococcota bacterium]